METAPPLERGWLLRLEPGLLKADWKRRFCVVDTETSSLRILKDDDKAAQCLEQILLLTTTVKPNSAKSFAFDLVSPQKTHSFACKDQQELAGWMSSLQRGIKDAINATAPAQKTPTSPRKAEPAIVVTPDSNPAPSAPTATPTQSSPPPAAKGWNFTLATAPHDGWLSKKKDGNWKRYWVELRGENLYLFDDRNPADPRTPNQHRGSVPIPLTLCTVRFGADTHARRSVRLQDPHTFFVVTQNETLELKADSSQEAMAWVTLFNNSASMSRRKARIAAIHAANPPKPSEAVLAAASSSTSPSSTTGSTANSALSSSGSNVVSSSSSDNRSPSPIRPVSTPPKTGALSSSGSSSMEDQNERIQRLASTAGNNMCADCEDKDPQWASINLGIFICIECSGLHRSLGTHISKVRSIDLDVWEKSTVDFMASMGNKKFNEIWEFRAELVEKDKPGPSDSRSDKEDFIQKKYLERLYGDSARLPATTPTTPRAVSMPINRAPLSSSSSEEDREVFHEGWLTKQGGSVQTWKQRWFVLKDNKLSYFHERSEVNPINTINMATAHVKSSPDRTNTFEVITPQRVWYFESDNSADFFLWMDLLRDSQQRHARRARQAVDGGSEVQTPASADVVKEGYLIKRGGNVKSWKKRWFVVKDNKLAYYASPGEKTPKGSIALAVSHVKICADDARTLGCPEDAFMFELITTGRVYYIGAPTVDERDSWMAAVKQSQQKFDTLRRSRPGQNNRVV